jgi:hypothetical protein
METALCSFALPDKHPLVSIRKRPFSAVAASAGLLVRRIAACLPVCARFVSRVLSVRGFVADKKPVAWDKSL